MAGMDAFGTQLQRGDGATPEVFTTIADVTSLDLPDIKRDTIDVTSHGSEDGWKEYLGGLVDGGEMKATVNYQPTLHDQFVDDFDDRQPRNYRVVFPDDAATTWQFGAILTEFKPSAPYDDKAEADLSWQITGKPTFTSDES